MVHTVPVNSRHRKAQHVGRIPAMAMYFVFKPVKPDIIALGGVLTGRWKAKLQARAAGKVSFMGCTSMARA